jgi:hypothetical protein
MASRAGARSLLAMLVALAGAAAAAAPAWSTFPGLNGRLAYEARSGTTSGGEAGREATLGISILQPLPGKLEKGTPLAFTRPSDRDAAWSPDGTQLALVREHDGNADIYLVNTDGRRERRLTGHSAVDADPAFSDDGRQLAFTSTRHGNREIYVMAVGGSALRRLTFDPAIDQRPDWSPDGEQIAFETTRDGHSEIYVMTLDGGAVTRLTFDGNNPSAHPSWHPDGGRIAFASGAPGARDIFTLRPGTDGRTRLTRGGYDPHFPAWSPDGKQIAFTSIANVCERTPRNITRVMTADGGGAIADRPACGPGDEAVGIRPVSPEPAAEGVNGAWGSLPPPRGQPEPAKTVNFFPLEQPLTPTEPSPVFVNVEGAVAAAPLEGPLELPVGRPNAEDATVIDTSGRAAMIEAATPDEASATSVLVSEGRAALSQTRRGLIELRLPRHPCCGARASRLRVRTRARTAAFAAARRGCRRRRGSGTRVKSPNHGRAYGCLTDWTTTRAGRKTTVRVREGVVEVTDFVRDRTVRVGDCRRRDRDCWPRDWYQIRRRR